MVQAQVQVVLKNYFFLHIDFQGFNLPNTDGINATQLVNMAPFTTSNSGKTTNISKERPTTCMASKQRTTKKSENVPLLTDLNQTILMDRTSVPTSGNKKAKHMHHIHANCSAKTGEKLFFFIKYYLSFIFRHHRPIWKNHT